jgi:hypothetical protein
MSLQNQQTVDSEILKSQEQTRQWEAQSRAFLSRFGDMDAFMHDAELVARYYFEQQREISDYEAYVESLKQMLQRYIFIYKLATYDAKKIYAEEGDSLEKKYHKLINFGMTDPYELLQERKETGMSIEAQKTGVK